MTPLAEILVRRIQAAGPITLAAYMQDCLLHPEHGYYATRDPLGAAGDFTTAPEISQMFGELIGLCLAQAWVDQGRPHFVLAELGPGRGTLMADLLRAGGRVPGFLDAADIHLVEASPTLQARQAETLAAYDVNWAPTIEALPKAPIFLVANEFFDALPIRQFERTKDGWSERMVAVEDGRLHLRRAPPTAYAALAHRLADTAPGDIVETCAPGTAIMTQIATRVRAHGGAALVVDYGGWRSQGDTFQALKDHRAVDPFDAPGEADLTAHVDFEALAQAAHGVQVSAMTPQGVFLEKLGITARAQILAQKLDGDALESHVAAHRRLTHPEEMGTLFKVIGCTPLGRPPLPGLTG